MTTDTDTSTTTDTLTDTESLRALRKLASTDPSARLQAALALGTRPDPQLVVPLIERCAVEPEFFVREMLTWALTRHSPATVLTPLIDELRSPRAQARSQSLHTLSKIGDPRAWPALTRAHLTDPDDDVARSAWRAAVVLVPEGEEAALAEVLASQLGRGERPTQLSLSRALIALGEVILPALRAATTAADPGVRQHALATERLRSDPDIGFEFALDEAKRIMVLGAESQEE
ncbi:HEAT repeat domain-containing protein [Streptomyces kanamyceticus]|uniref:HEAT repeat domain-containing protein n=1 Tax=Streptomyces kanamyceticus TaxID=1967 RepID=A0A5J6GYL4_STRKN|nr:HEAT repeat domain-containing protein [Streptomyces kanamyceticus]QEU97936.1 HEAT repeat domain-containing protein [Streptomyces kanamyceticus]